MTSVFHTQTIDQQTVVVGDCLSYLKAMPMQSIDCIVTSPPYNIGIDYSTYEDRKPRDVYLQWMREIAIEVVRVLKPDGAYFLNIGGTNIDPWLGFDVINLMRDVLVLQNHIIWVKSISIGDDTIGHFKPISSKRFLNNNHESVFHFTLDGQVPIDRLSIGVPFKDKTNITRRKHAQDKRCAGNIWFIPYETVKSKAQKFNHPAGFPVGLPEHCIRMHGHATGVVLDPFMGTGTTLVAAQRLGWSGIGIDIDCQYADTAIQRLQENMRRRTHPGTILREEFMVSLQVDVEALSESTGIARDDLESILTEKQSVTPVTAAQLAAYFDTTAEFWINLQKAHDASNY